MANRITELEINNFKSIKHLKMDCKRINVLIGKPNVGKSNILEALSLFIAPYGDPNKKMLEDYIRYEKLRNLFYDQDRKSQITVKTNLGVAALGYSANNNDNYEIIITPDITTLAEVNDLKLSIQKESHITDLQEKAGYLPSSIKPYYATGADNSNFDDRNSYPYTTPVKNYKFKTLTEHENDFFPFLMPPFGDNLYAVLEGTPELYNDCAKFLEGYKLDLVLDQGDEKIEISKRIGSRIYNTPYWLSADTLQRIIFHMAAIETNEDSILLLEEPESHSFPPYISLLAEKIIENESNQFFIATHSPYLLTPFIEQCDPKDISIFIASYENYETKIKALSDAEILNIMDTGIDLFYNISAFQK